MIAGVPGAPPPRRRPYAARLLEDAKDPDGVTTILVEFVLLLLEVVN